MKRKPAPLSVKGHFAGRFRLAAIPTAVLLPRMLIAWTTVSSATEAEHLADGSIAQNLAVCAQVEGPIHSHYVWEGRKTISQEWRITFKFLEEQSAALSAYIQTAHPYDTPQWIVVQADRVGEKYLSWARAPRSSVNL